MGGEDVSTEQNETKAGNSLPPPHCSAFMQTAINAELERLRETCRVERYILKSQKSVHPDNWGGSPEHSRKTRSEEIPKTEARLSAADSALAQFVREHKALMPPDWVANDHGRLCWNSFLGGRPIGCHYCDLPEGHDGPHSDEDGNWPNTSREAR
jgi:hypothetical protein